MNHFFELASQIVGELATNKSNQPISVVATILERHFYGSDLARKLAEAEDERDELQRDLDEIKLIVGCDHKRGIPECVRQTIEALQ